MTENNAHIRIPTEMDDERLKMWMHRVERAQTMRDIDMPEWKQNVNWEDLDHLKSYDTEDYTAINKVGSWLSDRLPAVMFRTPHFTLSPQTKRGMSMVTLSGMVKQTGQQVSEFQIPRYLLSQAHINNIVTSPDFGFRAAFHRFLKSAYVGFGALKCGHAPDMQRFKAQETDNLVRNRSGRVKIDSEGDPELYYRPGARFFADNMPFWRMIIDPDGGPAFTDHRYVGYEYWRLADEVKADDRFSKSAREKIEGESLASLKKRDEYSVDNDASIFYRQTKGGTEDESDLICRVYEMWDMVNREVAFFTDDVDEFLAISPFPPGVRDNPFVMLRFNERLTRWSPRTTMRDLIHLNEEYNDFRTQIRRMMRQNTRKFIMRMGYLQPAELAKLTNNRDMQIAFTAQDPGTGWKQFVHTGVSGESAWYGQMIMRDFDDIGKAPIASPRGASDAKTATAVSALQSQNLVGVDHERNLLTEAMVNFGRKMLFSIEENCTDDEMLLITGDDGTEIVASVPGEELIADYDLQINVQDMIPKNSDVYRALFVEVLRIVHDSPWMVAKPENAAMVLDAFGINDPLARNTLAQMAAEQIEMQKQAMMAGTGQGTAQNVPRGRGANTTVPAGV